MRIGVVCLLIGVLSCAVGAQQTGGTLNVVSAGPVQFTHPFGYADANSTMITSIMYDSLVSFDEHLEIVPQLAESWEISEEDLTLTFFLRNNVTFHNGRPMTADDVVFTFTFVMTPATYSVAGYYLSPYVESITALDEFTVQFRLSSPVFTRVLGLVGGLGAGIVAREYFEGEESTDFWSISVGTGPFRLVGTATENSVQMEAFPDYWDEELPYLDRVVFTYYPDPESRIGALITGEAHFFNDATLVDAELVAGNPQIQLIDTPGLIWHFLGFNHTVAPLDDVRVRRAIAYAIDRRAILDAAYGGGEEQLLGVGAMNAAVWYGSDDVFFPLDGDVDLARSLLADAGYPDGFEVRMKICPSFDTGYVGGNLCRAAMEEIGITVIVEEVTWEEQIAIVNSPTSAEADIFFGGFLGSHNPYDTYNIFHDGGAAWAGYSDVEVDAWVEQLEITTDRQEQIVLAHRIAQRLTEDVAVVFIANPAIYSMVRTSVLGYLPSMDGGLKSLRGVWIEN